MNTALWFLCAIATVLLSIACSKSANSSSSEEPKNLSFILEFDNTYQTFVPCAVSGGEIDCSGGRQEIPNLSQFRPYWNTNTTFIEQLAELPDGCRTGAIEDNSRIAIDKIEPPTGCRFKFRLYRETDTLAPWEEFGQPVRTDPSTPISGRLSFLTKYNFQIVNVDNNGACEQNVLHRATSSASSTSISEAVTIAPGELPFTGLFSLAAAPETLNTPSLSKDQDFEFKFQPAVDATPLISAGVTDDSITEYLAPYLGDFLVLYAEDSYGHKAFCKAPDAAAGSIRVPSETLRLFNGTTGFQLIRYKISRTKLGAAEMKILMKVGMYRDGTDAWGPQGGVVSLWVQ